ncbi:phosphopentomutase [Fulvimarina sp. 2208YS6-2-32]|uniref:Phosphopentomutase n=1 Tax=Fulvimarina uroteuthidis TaxID=3098149 RepID=A0ABU5I123_9HYPH|nr:phosphopentomutase [Fulvimarina sp. 2208YS6-2-32]MDY8108458.1 phosphopentomutase [Fulvimarina sp. 2208YS6-2-32]
MPRAIIIVLDSVGIGHAPDAADYGDAGANTLGSVFAACRTGRGDREGLRSGALQLPHLTRLGLMRVAGLGEAGPAPSTLHGAAVETSHGKDTPSGHWEIAGAPVHFAWGTFPDTQPALPASLVRQIMDDSRIPGILGDRRASGTEILRAFGEESIASGKPILYTSADSVLQIAAHETHFGLDRLMALCAAARTHCDPLNIARVIARPFTGETADSFERTAGRRDFSVAPPSETLLDRVQANGGTTWAVGKIADIFSHRGIGKILKGDGNMALVDATLAAIRQAGDGDLVFANLIDFDMLFGHRRDVPGYAAALEAFDARIPQIEAALEPGDLCILTADHGCDPSFAGTEHTRERVPVLGFGPGIAGADIGVRESFADIGASAAVHLGLDPGRFGTAFVQTA